jgi:hypothetical protein
MDQRSFFHRNLTEILDHLAIVAKLLWQNPWGKDEWDVIFHFIQTLTAAVTAVWAIWRFRKERTHTSHIELKIKNCNFFGPLQDNLLVEIVIIAKNAGKVFQKFESIQLRLRGILVDQPLAQWKDREPRAYFPENLNPNKKGFIEVVRRIPSGVIFSSSPEWNKRSPIQPSFAPIVAFYARMLNSCITRTRIYFTPLSASSRSRLYLTPDLGHA